MLKKLIKREHADPKATPLATPAELEAADATKGEFERFVGLEWNVQVTGTAGPNSIFVGAIGPVKPRLQEAGVA